MLSDRQKEMRPLSDRFIHPTYAIPPPIAPETTCDFTSECGCILLALATLSQSATGV
jgi:hypothetical protein